jgi:hypothetical protein
MNCSAAVMHVGALAGAAPGCRSVVAMIVSSGRLRLEPGGKLLLPLGSHL